MADADHEDIVYLKKNVYGTIYLTVDSQNPVIINFFHDIKIKVKLGIIRPRCELEQLPPEASLSQCLHEPLLSSVGVSIGNCHDNESATNPKENVTVSSVSENIPYRQDAFEVSETIEEFDESCNESEDKSVVSSVASAKPFKNTSKGKKVSLLHRKAHHDKHTLTSQPQNIFGNDSCNSPSSDKMKLQRHLKLRKQRVCDSLTAEPDRSNDKKEFNRKIKGGKLIKIKSHKVSLSPKLSLKNKVRHDVEKKIGTDQQNEKRSAKWKLACQTTCQYCLKVFETQQAFYDHKKTPISEVFKCSVCSKIFPFQAHLQAHTSTYHKHGQLVSNLKKSASCVCDVCGADVKNLFALKKHMMFHTREHIYSCCICGKQFVEHGTLNNHMTSHKSGGMIRCKCCDQLFATRAALAKHKLASMEVKCHLCGEVFPNKTSRTQHYKVSHQNDILKCSKCTSMFSLPEELTVHMKKHNLYKKKQCKTCGKFFSRLEKHVVTHKAKAEIDESELFVCDKCPKKFTNRSSFQRHLTIHSHDKPYQCPNCPRKFADCGALRKHLRRHLSLMPYVCEICGKKCKEPGNLKVHMRIHSDTKQFQCPMCPQAFNYKSSLEGHMRSRHSQNMNATNSLPQVPCTKQDVESSPQTIYGTSRTGPSQICESNSWKLSLDAGQTFPTAPNIEMKQFYENRSNIDIKNIYEDNQASLLARHTFQTHPMHVSPLDLDVVSKPMYVHDSAVVANVNISSAYTSGGNLVMNAQPREEGSMSVTSLDVTSLNLSSMNISLY